MSVASGESGRWLPQVEELVARIRDAIREAAGSALAGLYLFGSLVVGDFDVDVSDIDLIAVLTSDPSDDLVARLGGMHDALASENPVWAGRIEVIYVSAAALSRWWEGIARMAVISPGEPFHVVEGGPDWVLTWYPARERVMTLFGPPVETFIPPISREAFESAVRQHMRRFPPCVVGGTRCAWVISRRRSWRRPGRNASSRNGHRSSGRHWLGGRVGCRLGTVARARLGGSWRRSRVAWMLDGAKGQC